jgi:hypothetical protein
MNEIKNNSYIFTSEDEYNQAVASDPSFLLDHSLYSIEFYKDETDDMPLLINDSMKIIFGSDSKFNSYGYNSQTQLFDIVRDSDDYVLNNNVFIIGDNIELKYIESINANTLNSDIFSNEAKAYKFMAKRLKDEYDLRDQEDMVNGEYDSFEEFITSYTYTGENINCLEESRYNRDICFVFSENDGTIVAIDKQSNELNSSNAGSYEITTATIEGEEFDILKIKFDKNILGSNWQDFYYIKDGAVYEGEYIAKEDIETFYLFNSIAYNDMVNYFKSKGIDIALDVEEDEIIEIVQSIAFSSNMPSEIVVGENETFVYNLSDVLELENITSEDIVFELYGEDADNFEIIDNNLYFKQAPDYENPQDSDMDNIYNITLMASNDDSSLNVQKDIDIEVSNIQNIFFENYTDDDIELALSQNKTVADFAKAKALNPSMFIDVPLYEVMMNIDNSDKDYQSITPIINKMLITQTKLTLKKLDLKSLSFDETVMEQNYTPINNIIITQDFDIKYIGKVGYEKLNQTFGLETFSSDAKGYEFIFYRKKDGTTPNGSTQLKGAVFNVVLLDGATYNEYVEFMQTYDINLQSVEGIQVVEQKETQVQNPLSVNLKKGWNLLSLPTKAYLNKEALNKVFIDNKNIEMVAKYDFVGWSYIFKDDTVATLNEFTSLQSNEGFYVKANKDTTITYPFTANTKGSSEIQKLHNDWNLIGFNKDITPQEILSLYDDIKDKIESIWIYQNNNWKVFIPSASLNSLVEGSKKMNKDETIGKNLGIWIRRIQ